VAAVEGHGLARQTDDSLQEHPVLAGEHADSHHVSTLRFVKQVSQAVNEVETVLLVGRKHAPAVHFDWDEHKGAQQDANHHHHNDAHQRALRVAPDEHPL
jgi:hypothetical protein